MRPHSVVIFIVFLLDYVHSLDVDLRCDTSPVSATLQYIHLLVHKTRSDVCIGYIVHCGSITSMIYRVVSFIVLLLDCRVQSLRSHLGEPRLTSHDVSLAIKSISTPSLKATHHRPSHHDPTTSQPSIPPSIDPA